MSKATDRQEGGSHYRNYKIQPIEYILANGIGFLAGNVVKYVTRYKAKNGAEDIRKAIHYLELILEFEYGATRQEGPAKAIDGWTATPLFPAAAVAQCPGPYNQYNGPQPILRLNSEEADQVGDLRDER